MYYQWVEVVSVKGRDRGIAQLSMKDLVISTCSAQLIWAMKGKVKHVLLGEYLEEK